MEVAVWPIDENPRGRVYALEQDENAEMTSEARVASLDSYEDVSRK